MERVFVGVGSNLDPEKSVLGALKLLGREVRVVAISTFYRTEPIGRLDTPEYVNGVVEIETAIAPGELKHTVLRRVEERLGRIRNDDKYSPRTIDLDLLLYGDALIEEEGLVLPDTDITVRPFILIPLYELCPGLVLPDSGVKIANLVKVMLEQRSAENGVAQQSSRPAILKMEALEVFTDTIRVELGI